MHVRLGHSLLAFALLFGAAGGAAAQSLPSYVPLPAGLVFASPESLAFEERGEAEFWMKEGISESRQGRHWRGYLTFTSGSNPGAGATWASLLPALEKSGFNVFGSDGATTWTLKRAADGVESWLKVALGDYQDPLLELIEIAAATSTFTVPPPAEQPEKFGAQDDFPYLGHLPGMTLVQSISVDEPLDVTVSGIDAETTLAGNAHVVKSYRAIASLSRLQFAEMYVGALTRAGWTVRPRSPGSALGEGPVVAYYAREKRSLWATLSRSDPASDGGARLAVADLSSENWNAKLKRDCRMPLYGVHFDFAKATLQAGAEVELGRVLDLLLAERDLVVEIEGHTDSVGGEAANLALSEARARAVVQWLKSEGIEASRLSAKGLGETQPRSGNDTDAGRALNRRVEVHKTVCTPQ